MSDVSRVHLSVRIVTVREGETFPEPHDSYAVIGTGVERYAGGYRRVWDVALAWQDEDE